MLAVGLAVVASVPIPDPPLSQADLLDRILQNARPEDNDLISDVLSGGPKQVPQTEKQGEENVEETVPESDPQGLEGSDVVSSESMPEPKLQQKEVLLSVPTKDGSTDGASPQPDEEQANSQLQEQEQAEEQPPEQAKEQPQTVEVQEQNRDQPQEQAKEQANSQPLEQEQTKEQLPEQAKEQPQTVQVQEQQQPKDQLPEQAKEQPQTIEVQEREQPKDQLPEQAKEHPQIVSDEEQEQVLAVEQKQTQPEAEKVVQSKLQVEEENKQPEPQPAINFTRMQQKEEELAEADVELAVPSEPLVGEADLHEPPMMDEVIIEPRPIVYEIDLQEPAIDEVDSREPLTDEVYIHPEPVLYEVDAQEPTDEVGSREPLIDEVYVQPEPVIYEIDEPIEEIFLRSDPEVDEMYEQLEPEVDEMFRQVEPEIDETFIVPEPEVDEMFREAEPEVDEMFVEPEAVVNEMFRKEEPEVDETFIVPEPIVDEIFSRVEPEVDEIFLDDDDTLPQEQEEDDPYNNIPMEPEIDEEEGEVYADPESPESPVNIQLDPEILVVQEDESPVVIIPDDEGDDVLVMTAGVDGGDDAGDVPLVDDAELLMSDGAGSYQVSDEFEDAAGDFLSWFFPVVNYGEIPEAEAQRESSELPPPPPPVGPLTAETDVIIQLPLDESPIGAYPPETPVLSFSERIPDQFSEAGDGLEDEEEEEDVPMDETYPYLELTPSDIRNPAVITDTAGEPLIQEDVSLVDFYIPESEGPFGVDEEDDDDIPADIIPLQEFTNELLPQEEEQEEIIPQIEPVISEETIIILPQDAEFPTDNDPQTYFPTPEEQYPVDEEEDGVPFIIPEILPVYRDEESPEDDVKTLEDFPTQGGPLFLFDDLSYSPAEVQQIPPSPEAMFLDLLRPDFSKKEPMPDSLVPVLIVEESASPDKFMDDQHFKTEDTPLDDSKPDDLKESENRSTHETMPVFEYPQEHYESPVSPAEWIPDPEDLHPITFPEDHHGPSSSPSQSLPMFPDELNDVSYFLPPRDFEPNYRPYRPHHVTDPSLSTSQFGSQQDSGSTRFQITNISSFITALGKNYGPPTPDDKDLKVFQKSKFAPLSPSPSPLQPFQHYHKPSPYYPQYFHHGPETHSNSFGAPVLSVEMRPPHTDFHPHEQSFHTHEQSFRPERPDQQGGFFYSRDSDGPQTFLRDPAETYYEPSEPSVSSASFSRTPNSPLFHDRRQPQLDIEIYPSDPDFFSADGTYGTTYYGSQSPQPYGRYPYTPSYGTSYKGPLYIPPNYFPSRTGPYTPPFSRPQYAPNFHY